MVVGFPATPIIESRARFCLSGAHTKEMIDRVSCSLPKSFVETAFVDADVWLLLPGAGHHQRGGGSLGSQIFETQAGSLLRGRTHVQEEVERHVVDY